MNLDAVPALVNSRLGQRVAELAPTIHAFNHCIVRVKTNGCSRWYDPALPCQGGQYDSVFIPDFGLGLEVAEGVSALAEVNSSPPAISTVVESFELLPDSSSVLLQVQTVHRGAAADVHRHLLAAQGEGNTGQQFQNFYARHFGELEPDQPMEVDYDPEENTLAIRESYRLADPWKEGASDPDRKYLQIFAHPLFPALPIPTVTLRAFPFTLGPPMYIVYRAELRGAAPLRVEEEPLTIDGPGLHFERQFVQEGTVVAFTCRLIRQEEYVDPGSLEDYIATSKLIGEKAGFSYSRGLNPPKPDRHPFPWWIPLSLLGLLIMLYRQC